jgi:threonine synthase
MMHATGLRCLACGHEEPLNGGAYVCSACGANLEVIYDMAALRALVQRGDWQDARREDQFRYLPLMPLSDLAGAPPLRVGATPLYDTPRLAAAVGLRQVWVKDEGLNPSASFKDRASAMIVARAKEVGAAVVCCASTGNAGSSVACMAAAMQLPCVVFVPETAPVAKMTQLLIYGARVVAVRGTYDDAFDLCARVSAEKGWLNRNTGFNPFTREGKKTAAFEIAEQLGWQAPDRVIVPTGDGNIISGIGKGMRELVALGLIDRMPKIDCAQAEGSAAVTQAVWRLQAEGVPSDWRQLRIEPVQAETVADSISVDDPRDGLAAVRTVIESGGEAVTASDTEILDAIKEMAQLSGVFVEPSCACAWAGLRNLVAAGKVSPDERVVCLMTGSGLKDVARARQVAGEPVVIDADPDAAFAALADLD